MKWKQILAKLTSTKIQIMLNFFIQHDFTDASWASGTLCILVGISAIHISTMYTLFVIDCIICCQEVDGAMLVTRF